MNNFTELPTELLSIIFKNLSTIDLIKLKRVCKKWSFVINQIRIYDLIIESKPNRINYYDNNYFWKSYIRDDDFNYCTFKNDDKQWFLIKKSTDENKIIKFDLSTKNDLFIFKDQILFSKLFSKLKRLMINNQFNSIFISYLIHFENLEHLDLNFEISSSVLLYHPNLKIICINKNLNLNHMFKIKDFFEIKIDAINLEFLKYNGWYKLVDVFAKNKIKYLDRSFNESEDIYGNFDQFIDSLIDDRRLYGDEDELDEYGNPDEYYDENPIELFSNLETLVCDNILDLDIIELTKLPKLRRIVFKIPENLNIPGKKLTEIQFKAKLEKFIEEKNKLNLLELDIFLINDNKTIVNYDEIDSLFAKKPKIILGPIVID